MNGAQLHKLVIHLQEMYKQAGEKGPIAVVGFVVGALIGLVVAAQEPLGRDTFEKIGAGALIGLVVGYLVADQLGGRK